MLLPQLEASTSTNQQVKVFEARQRRGEEK